MRYWTVPVLAALAATLVPAIGTSVAHAQDSKRVVVRSFSGKFGARARGVAVDKLSDQAELVPNAEATTTAGDIGADLDSAQGYADLAQEMDIDAFVEGRIQRGRRGWRAAFRIRSGDSGEVVEEGSFVSRTAGGLASKIRRRSGSLLSSGIEAAQAPEQQKTPDAEPATESTAPDEQKAADEPESDGSSSESEQGPPSSGAAGSLEAVRAMVGIRAFSRKLTFEDDIFGDLREYDLGIGPAFAAAVSWYPGAHFTDGLAASVGLRGRLVYAFGLQSTPSRSGGSTQYDTSSHMYEIGPRFRYQIGIAELRLDVAYGKQQFQLEAGEEQKTGLPNTSYGYWRLGGGSTFQIGDRIQLDAHIAYLRLKSLGELGADHWFPRADGAGMLAQMGMSIRLGAGFSARVQGEIQRYFFSLNPEPGDPNVAGGMVDQYISGTAGLAWSY